MKKVKGIFATLLIFTILVGSIGLTYGIHLENQEITPNGGFTTLENPRPVAD